MRQAEIRFHCATHWGVVLFSFPVAYYTEFEGEKPACAGILRPNLGESYGFYDRINCRTDCHSRPVSTAVCPANGRLCLGMDGQ